MIHVWKIVSVYPIVFCNYYLLNFRVSWSHLSCKYYTIAKSRFVDYNFEVCRFNILLNFVLELDVVSNFAINNAWWILLCRLIVLYLYWFELFILRLIRRNHWLWVYYKTRFLALTWWLKTLLLNWVLINKLSW